MTVEFCDVCNKLLQTDDELMDKLCEDCLKNQLMVDESEGYEELDFDENNSYYEDIY